MILVGIRDKYQRSLNGWSCAVYFQPINYRPHPKDGEGNIFTLCVSSHLDWGGGVTPSQVWTGGVPHSRSERGAGTPSQVWMRVGGLPDPRSGGGGGTPSQVWMVGGGGYSPGQDWMGYLPHRSGWWGDTPPARTGWGTRLLDRAA